MEEFLNALIRNDIVRAGRRDGRDKAAMFRTAEVRGNGTRREEKENAPFQVGA